jgi:hypothetical protein
LAATRSPCATVKGGGPFRRQTFARWTTSAGVRATAARRGGVTA